MDELLRQGHRKILRTSDLNEHFAVYLSSWYAQFTTLRLKLVFMRRLGH